VDFLFSLFVVATSWVFAEYYQMFAGVFLGKMNVSLIVVFQLVFVLFEVVFLSLFVAVEV